MNILRNIGYYFVMAGSALIYRAWSCWHWFRSRLRKRT